MLRNVRTKQLQKILRLGYRRVLPALVSGERFQAIIERGDGSGKCDAQGSGDCRQR